MNNLASTVGDGHILLWFIEFFLLVIWFWLLIVIFGDLFRDHETSGWAKAAWVLFVVILPFLGILVYLIVRGKGMAERSQRAAQEMQDQFDAQVRRAAGSQGSAADQIASAKSLLDSGAINQDEFDKLKAKALGS